MKITLERKTAPFHFEAKNDRNIIVSMDSSTEIGGLNKGASPMEFVLMGLGGCASIDLGLILSKQQQILTNYKLLIEGLRDETPAKAFKKINMHFILHGTLESSKVEKALDLTLNKYCSVALSLSKEIEIVYTYEIINS